MKFGFIGLLVSINSKIHVLLIEIMTIELIPLAALAVGSVLVYKALTTLMGKPSVPSNDPPLEVSAYGDDDADLYEDYEFEQKGCKKCGSKETTKLGDGVYNVKTKNGALLEMGEF